MFIKGAKGLFAAYAKRCFIAHCDVQMEDDDDDNTIDLIQQTDATIENEKLISKTPMQFENLKHTLNQGSVNSYDGFRVVVQKQVNLNSVVSHFYWIGSQNTGGNPIYQYRLILPLQDDKVVNVATDMDFNIECEVKVPITPNVLAKSNFTIHEQSKNLSFELEAVDSNSATQLKYIKSSDTQYQLSYMQRIIANLTMGGKGTFSSKNSNLDIALGLFYNPQEHILAIQYDKEFKIMYLRKVNPNRVHLSTDLTIDETGNSLMAVNAEFMLKQSKIHMGIDSNLLLKSYLETSISPTTQLQFGAEMLQHANHYRFGFGIVLNS